MENGKERKHRRATLHGIGACRTHTCRYLDCICPYVPYIRAYAIEFNQIISNDYHYHRLRNKILLAHTVLSIG